MPTTAVPRTDCSQESEAAGTLKGPGWSPMASSSIMGTGGGALHTLLPSAEPVYGSGQPPVMGAQKLRPLSEVCRPVKADYTLTRLLWDSDLVKFTKHVGNACCA